MPLPPVAKTALGRHAMVSTGHPLAARAALDILRQGGNAVDAAIAADAVMGVVEPMATSVGGDLLAMIVPAGGAVVSYNGTGRAPARLLPALVEALPGRRIPERHPLAVTTPGAVQGWHDLHQRLGRAPWSGLFQSAIATARDGFAVTPITAREWKLFASTLLPDATARELFRAEAPPASGDRFHNPELAALLDRIAALGPAAFYQGAIPAAAARAVQAAGGVLDAGDFGHHSGHFCPPVHADFHGYRIHQCPPNTHGVAILEALGRTARSAAPPDSAQATLELVEATEQALAQASRTVADPAGNTVCTVVVDQEGLAITLMSSIFKRFGCGIAVPGGGFVLQNRGFGFATPGHINGPAPGKRPYHTVVPGAVTRGGHFEMAQGVVGGLMQPQGQIQLLTRILAWRQDAAAAMSAPRWRLEAGRTLALESGMDEALAAALREAGYPAPAKGTGELAGRSDFGGAQLVRRLPDGGLQGVSDPRKDGIALGF